MTMFCYQCEQTAKGTGCTVAGVCGKDADTAALQDVLIHLAEGIARYAHRARAFDARDAEADAFVVEALFTTVTNVNFDPERLAALIGQGKAVLDKAKALYESACAAAGQQPEDLSCPSGEELASDVPGLVAQGQAVSIAKRLEDYEAGALELPEGCEVTYELEAIEHLRALLRSSDAHDEGEAFYRGHVLREHGDGGIQGHHYVHSSPLDPFPARAPLRPGQ